MYEDDLKASQKYNKEIKNTIHIPNEIIKEIEKNSNANNKQNDVDYKELYLKESAKVDKLENILKENGIDYKNTNGLNEK